MTNQTSGISTAPAFAGTTALLALLGLLALGCEAQTPSAPVQMRDPVQRSPGLPPSAPLESHLFQPAYILDRQAAISLTPAQRDAIVADVRRTQSEWVDADARLRAQRERLAQLLDATHVDEASATRATAALIETEGRIKTLHLGMLVRIKNRLSPEQQAQLRR